ncbi:hypothetical protein ACFQJC_07995 [Haloferax namakaokahaiae]|uniref:Uncharacterized protein n=1 Tax=Haloferax namakaokahaiae TaxID=1748331 RepID=A0ABD5ZE47_9EURY
MDKPSVKCALISTLIAKHKWGTPMDRDTLLSLSAIGNDYPTARTVYDDLRGASYITYRGKRGIELNSGAFAELADVLYYDCNWEKYEIQSRLKHYEGIEKHDWA